MSKLNDLSALVKEQESVLAELVYEQVIMELDEDAAEANMRIIIRALNDLFVKLDVAPVSTNNVDRFGREK